MHNIKKGPEGCGGGGYQDDFSNDDGRNDLNEFSDFQLLSLLQLEQKTFRRPTMTSMKTETRA